MNCYIKNVPYVMEKLFYISILKEIFVMKSGLDI
jgi:hypothetical protein